jgi:signal transduction histidine kinase
MVESAQHIEPVPPPRPRDRLMVTRQQPIEPGLLPVFRYFLVALWTLVSLALCGTLGKRSAVPDYFNLMSWAHTTLLLPYLYWNRLRRMLGRAYLPLALGVASLAPVVEVALATALRMQHGIRGNGALVDPSSLYLWLLLPLLLISAQYGMRTLFTFTAGTSILSVVLAVALAAAGGPASATTAQQAIGRFVVFSVVGVVLVSLSKAQRRQRAEQERKHVQLAQYALTLEQLAVSRERNRIARELHDTLAHTLSALSVQLAALGVLWEKDPGAARATLQQLQDMTRGGLDEARRALHELRARPIEELGLALALRRQAEQAADRAGFQLTCTVPPYITGARTDIEQQLYQVADEALNNVVRHARARRVSVMLTQQGETLRLTIADDGAGFDPAQVDHQPGGHYGLIGMRERAALIGAALEIRSRLRQGTVVELSCQLAKGAA